MRLYCQYSGINYHLPAFSKTLQSTVLTVHPAFHMELKQLDELYKQWEDGEITEPNDCRLLFLALLNSTQLIDWHTTANPQDSTVQQHMSSVYETCKWVTNTHLPHLKLPRFAITKDTRSLYNIQHIMGVWEQLRADFDAGYKTQTALEKQRNREAMLERLINSPKDSTKYAGLLCQWGFAAADVPEALHAYWRQIICTKGVDILSLRKADIDEIVEHFEDALIDNASIYSHTLLKHCRNIQKMVVTGLGFNISTAVDLVDVVTRSDFTIMQQADITDTERLNVQRLINSAPSEAPVEANYANKVAFLRAKISYDMAQRAAASVKNAQQQLEDNLAQQFAEDQLLQSEADEADDENSEGDI